MPRALVTGGAGFLGGQLAAALQEHGYEIRILDVHPPAAADAVGEFVEGDVRDRESVQHAVAGCDVVVDNAALVPVTRATAAAYLDVNATGARNVLSAAREAGAYAVHISSSAIYGVPTDLPVSESAPLRPFEPYGGSKAEAERVVEQERQLGLAVASLRPRAVLGKGRLGLFEMIFRRIRAGKAVPMFGNGGARIQMCDAEDFNRVLIAAVERRAEGAYNVGSAGCGTVRQDLEALIAHAGTRARLRGVPLPVVRAGLRGLGLLGMSPFTEWHVVSSATDFEFNLSKAEAELAWRPRFTNAEALCRAYDAWKESPEAFGESPHRRPLRGPLARLLR